MCARACAWYIRLDIRSMCAYVYTARARTPAGSLTPMQRLWRRTHRDAGTREPSTGGMGQCSSSCFPFTGPVPGMPPVLLDVPESKAGEGFTFLIHRDQQHVNPWGVTSDVQWRVQNAERQDWMFLTTNSDWEHFESLRGLWAIVRRYHPRRSRGGLRRGARAGSSKSSRDLLYIYLRLQRSRGLVHATFVQDGKDLATASWFVTPAAVECMGCQVAVELRGTRGGVSDLDWQLRRVDPTTLVLNHIDAPAVIIQLRLPEKNSISQPEDVTLVCSEEDCEEGEMRASGNNRSGMASADADGRPTSFGAATRGRGDAATFASGSTPRSRQSNGHGSPQGSRPRVQQRQWEQAPGPRELRRRVISRRYASTHAFCVHTAETENPLLMLAMGFFFGCGVIRSVRRRWECAQPDSTLEADTCHSLV